ncbi:hypothetical protein BRX37_06030 [Sphingomonas sp. S-NIH.Pt3_0716]|jgi:hypothetical protein|nr:hypothetical protein BRX37_06030 [Sphingomonas sp. S-NIH.Pt3_0716]
MIEAQLVAHLAALCPNMYPGAAPLDYSTPCVVYNRIATDPNDDLEGWTGEGWLTFQIDVYDPSYLAAKELAADIRDHMIEWDDDTVQSVTWIGETDMIDETTDTSLFRTMLQFRLFAVL